MTTSLRPQRWTPPKAPELTGRWAPTGDLGDLELWQVPGEGPEDVVIAGDGSVYSGLRDGRLVRVVPDASAVEVVARLESPILGVEVLSDHELLVCAAHTGLVAVDTSTGDTRTLLGDIAGRPLVLTNNATVLDDGAILFSESSQRFGLDEYRTDLIEQSATGGLYRFDPSSGEVERLLGDLSFANGVTLSAAGDAALVAETGRYRIRRVWLDGPRAGQDDEFVSNLPGSPDNLSTGPTGIVWCAMPSLRVPALDLLLPRAPWLRQVVTRIPESLQPQPTRTAFALGFAADGSVVHNLRTDGGPYHFVTGVREHDGWLYLSSLSGFAIARTRLA